MYAGTAEDVVLVVDVWERACVDSIPVGEQPYALAAMPATNRVYVCNAFVGTVSVIE
jgi:DNA-binding beta-propeller fold protein YncE